MSTIHLRKNITVIVSTVVVEDDRILMMQEAKKECLGTWYLPAGRLEKHETLTEGARRECQEETGLLVNIVAILSIEIHSPRWLRVNFVGKSIGGVLKKSPDKESLSASWIPLNIILEGGNSQWPLRAPDIVQVVKDYMNRGHSNPGILPIEISHGDIQFQLFVLFGHTSLIVDKVTGKTPTLIADLRQSVKNLLNNFFLKNFSNFKSSVIDCDTRVLSVEFSGTARGSQQVTDGLRLELLIRLNEVRPELLDSSALEWTELSELNRHPNMTTVNDLPPLVILH